MRLISLAQTFISSLFSKDSNQTEITPKNPEKLNLPDLVVLLGLALTWIIAVCIVNPIGDFPLNDDWSYGRSVKVLLDEHKLYFDGWNTATLFFQLIYGALYCIPDGFSFTALRLSTLVISLFGILSLYLIQRQIKVPRIWSICGCAILMFNPIYFVNSFNFMTDIPYVALEITAALFFIRAFTSDSTKDEVIGFIILACATLIRQISLPVAIAYGVVVILKYGFNRKAIIKAIWPTLGIIILLIFYNNVINTLHLTSALHDSKQKEISLLISKLGTINYLVFVIKNIIHSICYLCIFISPFSFIFAKQLYDKIRTEKALHASVFSITLITTILIIISTCLAIETPLIGSSINGISLGINDLRNAGEWNKTLIPSISYLHFSTRIYVFISVLTTFSTFIVAIFLSLKNKFQKNNANLYVIVFSFIICLGYLGPFSLFKVFDRYFLTSLPFSTLLLITLGNLIFSKDIQTTGRLKFPDNYSCIRASFFILFMTGIWSTLGTHDYLEWNRVRWQSVTDMINKDGIQPDQIEGGFAVSGWYLYSKNEELTKRWNIFYAIDGEDAFAIKSPQYLVTFDAEGYPAPKGREKFLSYPLSLWLPSSKTWSISVYH